MFQGNPVGVRMTGLVRAAWARWVQWRAGWRPASARPAENANNARPRPDDLTRVEFERLVRRAFRLQGYRQVRKQARHEAWNIDLVLFKNGGLWFVQCEPDPASRIDGALVQDMATTCQQRSAQGAFMVTAGTFTRQARMLAQAHQIRLVDGSRLASWRQQVRLARRRRERLHASPVGASG